MEEPITLVEACKLYPRSRLTVSTLRAEAARRRLEIFRLGKRDYTTQQAMAEMVRRCREEDYRRILRRCDKRRMGHPRRRTLCTHGLR